MSAGLVALLCLVAGRAQEPPAPRRDSQKDKDQPLPWLTSLADGYPQAQRRRVPILVRFERPGCPWCAKLEEELRRPKVQAALANWTLVVLDSEKSEKEVRTL